MVTLFLTSMMLVAFTPGEATAAADPEGSWRPTSTSPVSNRYWHTATALPDGRVLMAGGHFPESFVPTFRSEVYTPGTDSWTGVASMKVPRERHTATLLQGLGCGTRCGLVLVTGGVGEVGTPATPYSGAALGSAELYDPVNNSWAPAAPLRDLRANHTATLLPDGTVLLTGGLAARSEGEVAVPTDSAETYDPITGVFLPTSGVMTTARGDHTATVLPNGKVLIAGRLAPNGSSTEIYDPASRTFSATGSLATGRSNHTATLLPDGKVLVTGGSGAGSSAELFDYTTGQWTSTAPMKIDRSGHTATLLPNGEVLVAGGSNDSTSAELYNPSNGQWRPTGDMTTPRAFHTATMLSSGKVLATGGSCRSSFFPKHTECPWAEVYATGLDPVVSVGDVSVTEGDAGTRSAVFSVSLSKPSTAAAAVTVAYATTDATAASPGDYIGKSGTLTFAAGVTNATVKVPIAGDTVDEVNEAFTVSLSLPVQAVISDSIGTATIVDDDGPIVAGPTTFFAVGDVSITEGTAGTTPATFVVTRFGDLSGTSSVKYTTADATAIAPGDYTAKAVTTLRFAPGESTKEVNVDVAGDTGTEIDETFRLTLSAPVGAVIADSSGTATIVNDDFSAFSVTDVSVTEGNAGTVVASFTITRAGNTSGAATVSYKTLDSSATAASGDYSSAPLTPVSFAAGVSFRTVSVAVTGDTNIEPNETFTVNLSSPIGGVISDISGTGTIVNDD